LSFLQFFLDTKFSTNLSFKNLLWHSSVDSHQSRLFLLELLFSDGKFLEVMLFLVL
jgi:hypothetical protein